MAKGPGNPERSFGISVGGVLLLIAGLLLWRGRLTRAEVLGGVGGVLLVEFLAVGWARAAGAF